MHWIVILIIVIIVIIIFVVIFTNQHLFPGAGVWVKKTMRDKYYYEPETYSGLQRQWVDEIEYCEGASKNCLYGTIEEAKTRCSNEISCKGVVTTDFPEYSKYGKTPAYALVGRDKLGLSGPGRATVKDYYRKHNKKDTSPYEPIGLQLLGCVDLRWGNKGEGILEDPIPFNLSGTNIQELAVEAQKRGKHVLLVTTNGNDMWSIFASRIKRTSIRDCASTYSLRCGDLKDIPCGCRKDAAGRAVCNDLANNMLRYAVYIVSW